MFYACFILSEIMSISGNPITALIAQDKLTAGKFHKMEIKHEPAISKRKPQTCS